jgi:ABC-type Zn uptake system ZnuABC Zn-binding protein ZnuA
MTLRFLHNTTAAICALLLFGAPLMLVPTRVFALVDGESGENPAAEETVAADTEKSAPKLIVCATTPTLGALAREIGGNEIELHVLSAANEDPHSVGPNNEFRDALATADVYIRNGVGLESGWTPARGGQRRPNAILPGGIGYIDAGHAAKLRDVPSSDFPPTAGSAHLLGNPHYLLDPLNAVKVARFLEARFRSLRPALSREFRARRELFESRVTEALIGPQLASRYRVDSLAELFERGELRRFLESQNQLNLLGGWLGRMIQHENKRIVADAQVWTYFLKRFGLRIEGYLDPIAGKSGHIAHLRELGLVAKERDVKALVASVYGQNLRHVEFAALAGVKTAILEHETGRLPNTKDYVEMIGTNVSRLLSALEGTGGPEIDEAIESMPVPKLPASLLDDRRPRRVPAVPPLPPMPEAARTPTPEIQHEAAPEEQPDDDAADAADEADEADEANAATKIAGDEGAVSVTDPEAEPEPTTDKPDNVDTLAAPVPETKPAPVVEASEPEAAKAADLENNPSPAPVEPEAPADDADQPDDTEADSDSGLAVEPTPEVGPDSKTETESAPKAEPELKSAPEPNNKSDDKDNAPRVKPRRGVLFL